MDVAFRKIDIDIYDEEYLNEAELFEADPRSPAEALDEARQRQQAVRSSLNKYVDNAPFLVIATILSHRNANIRLIHPTLVSSSRSDVVGALSIVLQNPPYGPNVEEAKEVTLQTLLTILNTTKAAEISNVVKALSQDEQDTLMKYIYKGMAMPGWGDISGSVLLGWHEKLTEVAGTGCIVRVMTDRRLV